MGGEGYGYVNRIYVSRQEAREGSFEHGKVARAGYKEMYTLFN
jgi:hypothetical protein